MIQNLEFEITNPKKSEQLVMDFYRACSRETKLEVSDTIILAKDASEVVGVVRLCIENGCWVLRTMQVRDDLQGKGFGRHILNRFKQLLSELDIQQVYCIPYAHLESFYGLIGFKKIDDSIAPAFLKARAENFHQRNPEKRVILMST